MRISRQEDIDINLYIEHLQRYICQPSLMTTSAEGDGKASLKMPIKILKDMSPHEKPVFFVSLRQL